jgi:hypothetical protein
MIAKKSIIRIRFIFNLHIKFTIFLNKKKAPSAIKAEGAMNVYV